MSASLNGRRPVATAGRRIAGGAGGAPASAGRCLPAVLLVILVSAVALPAFGDGFDGTRPLSGQTGRIVEIHPSNIIGNVDPDTVGLPKKFIIDFAAGRLRPAPGSLVRKTMAFNGIEQMDNLLVLHGIAAGVEGVDDGLAWTLTISREDGQAVLAAAGRGRAYVVFGVCRPAGTDPGNPR